MIRFVTHTAGLTPAQLHGFFIGWPHPPSPETHLRVLESSDQVVLAFDDDSNRVVGFITAITDGVLAAYIPLLEVLPEYQHRQIGGQLVLRMLDLLSGLYMVDLVCDPALVPFYHSLGLVPAQAMMRRSYDRQSGRPDVSPESGTSAVG